MERTVLITGASRGLGEGVARAFWAGGAHVLLVARRREALQKLASGLGERVSVHSADLADPVGAADTLAWARNTVPTLDVLVNNAAISGPIGRFWTNDEAAWNETLQVNLLSPAALMRGAIPWMAAHGGGAIINISGGGATAPRPNFSAYATAKTALARLTETAAIEAAELGVRINSIAPGVMDSELLRDVLRASESDAGEERAKVAAMIAAGKTTDPAVPARLCVYLASDAARNITGRLISAQWDPWERLEQVAGELQPTDIYTLRRIVPKDRGRDWDPK